MRPSLLVFVTLLASCAPATPTDSTPAAPSEPWALEAVKDDTASGIRILIVHDMEGLSGQDDPRTFDFESPVYPKGQELLAADINAAVEGLYAGGATEVHLADGHGSGNPDPDVRRDLLDPRANQVLRDQEFDTYFGLSTPGAYDAIAVVEMHAKTGSRGLASHTLTLGIGVVINGREMTKTELMGLSWGRPNVPIIFASGDDRLAADLAGMTWLEYVAVKKAMAADSAELRPVAEAHAELTAKARKAVENLRAGRTQSMRASMPLVAGLKAVPPASLAMLEGIPGIAYQDSVLSFPADSIKHAYGVIEKLAGAATGGYLSVLRRGFGPTRRGPRSWPSSEQTLSGRGSTTNRAGGKNQCRRRHRPEFGSTTVISEVRPGRGRRAQPHGTCLRPGRTRQVTSGPRVLVVRRPMDRCARGDRLRVAGCRLAAARRIGGALSITRGHRRDQPRRWRLDDDGGARWRPSDPGQPALRPIRRTRRGKRPGRHQAVRLTHRRPVNSSLARLSFARASASYACWWARPGTSPMKNCPVPMSGASTNWSTALAPSSIVDRGW